jgi:predicted membrane-bound spermidine synthase
MRDAAFYENHFQNYLKFIENELKIPYTPWNGVSKASYHYASTSENTFDSWDIIDNSQVKKDTIIKCVKKLMKKSKFKNPAYSVHIAGTGDWGFWAVCLRDLPLPGEKVYAGDFVATHLPEEKND